MTRSPGKWYPILMNVLGRELVVIGGGSVAGRKLEALLECGARPTVIAPRLGAAVRRLVDSGRVRHVARRYRPGDLAGARLALIAVADPEASSRAAAEASRRGIPVNVADRPELSSFILPSVLRRGRLTVAVSTGGASPAWARRIRLRLEAAFGPEYALLFERLARARRRTLDRVRDGRRRRRLLRSLADDSLLELARAPGARALGSHLARLTSAAGADRL